MMIRFFKTDLERDCRYLITLHHTVHRSPMWFTQDRHVVGINILSIKSLTLVGLPTSTDSLMHNRKTGESIRFFYAISDIRGALVHLEIKLCLEGTGLMQWLLYCSCGLDRLSLQAFLGCKDVYECCNCVKHVKTKHAIHLIQYYVFMFIFMFNSSLWTIHCEYFVNTLWILVCLADMVKEAQQRKRKPMLDFILDCSLLIWE